MDNLAVVGLVGFLILATGGSTALVFRRMEPRRAVITGVVASTLGSLLVVGASVVGTAALVIVAAAVIGFTNGLILQGGTTICSCVVPMHERGKLVSALFMCCYAGTVPSVGLGYLSRAIGLTATMAVFSAVAGMIATFMLVVGRRNFREVDRLPGAGIAGAGTSSRREALGVLRPGPGHARTTSRWPSDSASLGPGATTRRCSTTTHS